MIEPYHAPKISAACAHGRSVGFENESMGQPMASLASGRPEKGAGRHVKVIVPSKALEQVPR